MADAEDIWSPASQTPQARVRGAWAASWCICLAFLVSPWGYTLLTSPQPITPITPSTWALDIWLAIFALQTLGIVYMALSQGYEPDGDKQRSVNATASNWVLTGLCVLGWLAGQANGTPGAAWLGLAAISVGLFAALHSLLRLYRIKSQFGRTSSRLLYVSYLLPTSMLAAWLALAVAQAALAAVMPSLDPSAVDAAGAVLLVAATTAGAGVLLLARDTAFGLTLVWGLMGTYERAVRTSGGTGSPHATRWAALGSIVLTVTLCAASVLRRRPPPPRLEDLEACEPLRSQEV